MLPIDSSTGPVDIPLYEDQGRPWVWGMLLGILPAGVVVSRCWHPVAWWGWLAAAALGGLAVWVASRPAPRRRVHSLVADGDQLRFVVDGQPRVVPASRIVRVAGRGEGWHPVLVLDDGSEVGLPLRQYWHGSAVPSARVLARWVVSHGGGTGTWDGTVRTAPVAASGMSLWQRLAIMVGAWVLLCLCLSAIAGNAAPRFQNLGGLLGAAMGSHVVARQVADARVKDWMAPPPQGLA